MENRIKRLFLISLTCSLGILTAVSLPAVAQDDEEVNPSDSVLDKIITPDMERRVIEEDILDNEDFEIGFYAGVLSIEDFGSNSVVGVRLAYHVTEDFFLEGTYALSNLQETSFERLSGSTPLFTDEQRELSYYNIAFGWNMLPGEVFIGKNWAFNTSFYLIAGAGSTSFADEQHFTYSIGGGLRIALTDWLSFHVDMRDHIFSHDLLGEDITTQNLEAHIGLTLFF
ncbi:MAG: outer membrane beta-barrel domain-containing protein [Cellvibrionaceae bacterium]